MSKFTPLVKTMLTNADTQVDSIDHMSVVSLGLGFVALVWSAQDSSELVELPMILLDKTEKQLFLNELCLPSKNDASEFSKHFPMFTLDCEAVMAAIQNSISSTGLFTRVVHLRTNKLNEMISTIKEVRYT
jgi:hypothetical protein